jgi:hypothetical protein
MYKLSDNFIDSLNQTEKAIIFNHLMDESINKEKIINSDLDAFVIEKFDSNIVCLASIIEELSSLQSDTMDAYDLIRKMITNLDEMVSYDVIENLLALIEISGSDSFKPIILFENNDELDTFLSSLLNNEVLISFIFDKPYNFSYSHLLKMIVSNIKQSSIVLDFIYNKMMLQMGDHNNRLDLSEEYLEGYAKLMYESFKMYYKDIKKAFSSSHSIDMELVEKWYDEISYKSKNGVVSTNTESYFYNQSFSYDLFLDYDELFENNIDKVTENLIANILSQSNTRFLYPSDFFTLYNILFEIFINGYYGTSSDYIIRKKDLKLSKSFILNDLIPIFNTAQVSVLKEKLQEDLDIVNS